MKTYAIRLVKGLDLLLSIQQYAEMYDIKAATVISSVGCVSRAKLRDASGRTIKNIEEPMEIISVNGTVSAKHAHLHASFAKEDLSIVGGHLAEGCIINTTCELVLLGDENLLFDVEYDEDTGFDELLIRRPSF